MYDLSYIYDAGINVRGLIEDTMLMHHVLQPELPKSLGFLASIYCNNPAWKHMRTQKKKDVNKRDE